MTTLTWPAGIVPQSVAWHLEANTATFTSPLTGATQTVELPGARWVADFSLPTLRADQWRAWAAFIARLRGQSGRVYVPPFHAKGGSSARRAGTGSGPTCDSTLVTCDSTTYTVDDMTWTTLGAPRINGAGQSGATLRTDGWTPGATIFAAGDFFSYDTSAGRTLHMVTAATIAEGDGSAALAVEPPIRTAPNDNAPLDIDAPSCVMMLADRNAGALSLQPGIFGSASVALREVF